jgi:hypothetical protein
LEKLGQGIHALQDAIAHEGAKTNDHLGANWSSVKKFNRDIIGGGALQAFKLTRSAMIVIDVLNGKKDRLKDGQTLNLMGMSSSHLQKFLSALVNLGFKGKLKNE